MTVLLEEQLRAHLKEELNGVLKTVEGGLEFAGIGSGSARSPSAFVFRLQDRGTARQLIGATRQTIRTEMAVVLVMKNTNSRSGAAITDDLERLRQKLRVEIVGLSPAPGYDPYGFSSGRLLDLRAGWAFWQDIFVTESIK